MVHSSRSLGCTVILSYYPFLHDQNTMGSSSPDSNSQSYLTIRTLTDVGTGAVDLADCPSRTEL